MATAPVWARTARGGACCRSACVVRCFVREIIRKARGTNNDEKTAKTGVQPRAVGGIGVRPTANVVRDTATLRVLLNCCACPRACDSCRFSLKAHAQWKAISAERHNGCRRVAAAIRPLKA